MPPQVFAQLNDVRLTQNQTAMATTAAVATASTAATQERAEALAALRRRLPSYDWYLRIQFTLASASRTPAAPAIAEDTLTLAANLTLRFKSQPAPHSAPPRPSVSPVLHSKGRWASHLLAATTTPVALSSVASDTAPYLDTRPLERSPPAGKGVSTHGVIAAAGGAHGRWVAEATLGAAAKTLVKEATGEAVRKVASEATPEREGSELCTTSSKIVLMYPQDAHARADRLNRYNVGSRPKVRPLAARHSLLSSCDSRSPPISADLRRSPPHPTRVNPSSHPPHPLPPLRASTPGLLLDDGNAARRLAPATGVDAFTPRAPRRLRLGGGGAHIQLSHGFTARVREGGAGTVRHRERGARARDAACGRAAPLP